MISTYFQELFTLRTALKYLMVYLKYSVMVMKIKTMFFVIAVFVGFTLESAEKKFVLVVPSYNNEEWFEKNISSILEQNYNNYRVIYLNDCSADHTGQCVEECVQKYTEDYQVISFDGDPNGDILSVTKAFSDLVNKRSAFFTLVNNQQRCGALANIYRAVHSTLDDEIIVTIDGDDWFPHTRVLRHIEGLYASDTVWLTHGRFVETPTNLSCWSLKNSKQAVAENRFREERHPSHLRTFYSWLFKKIKLADLLYEGSFFPMTWDMAIMFPMIEMAGERHSYSHRINYVYNMENQINDNKVDAKLQNDLDVYIRSLPSYQRLEQ